MKKEISLLLVITVLFSLICVPTVYASTGQDVVNDLINNYVGKYPYVLNTHGPNTFDCSGLVYYVYKQHGITLPYTTRTDWKQYGQVITDRSQLQSGDVLLFGSSESNLNHIGIYDANGGYIIHALNSRYGIIRKPTLSEWVSDVSWNSSGNNQFQFAVRVINGSSQSTTPSNSEPNHYISNPNRTLRWKELNSTIDETVRELQICLNIIINTGLTVDGVYGIATHDAVKEFQRRYGLTVDGDAGPMTLNKVNEVMQSIETGESDVTAASVPTNVAVSVKNYDVSVTWNASSGAENYDVYLVQEPWGWENIQYKGNTKGTSYTFENVQVGSYAAFVIARPNSDNQAQSKPWAWFDVSPAHEHSYSKKYESEHPHKEYKICACGDKQYTGEITKELNCEVCYPHEHQYGDVKNEKAHPHRQYMVCECGDKKYTGGTQLKLDCEICYPPDLTITVELQIGIPVMSVDREYREIDPGRGTVPVIQNGRTLLPIRAVVEAFGAYIIWNESEQKVMIYSDDGMTMEFWINSKIAVVNGQSFEMDVAPVIINGRTFMPLRFIAEKMGLDVEWKEATRSITIIGEAE